MFTGGEFLTQVIAMGNHVPFEEHTFGQETIHKTISCHIGECPWAIAWTVSFLTVMQTARRLV